VTIKGQFRKSHLKSKYDHHCIVSLAQWRCTCLSHSSINTCWR